MSNVLVERPRLRYAKKGRGSHHPRAALAHPYGPEIDDAPQKSGIAWFHRDKWPNENLAPLRRFLVSQVGRPWSNVHSELSAHVSRDSAVQAHIFQHIDDYVARSVELRDGQPFRTDGYRIGWILERRGDVQLYVCPRSGLLRRAKRAAEPARRFGRVVRLHDCAELREVDGKWVVAELRPIRPVALGHRELHDALLDEIIDPSWFDERGRYAKLFGRTHSYATSVRAPGLRERKRVL